MECSMRKKFRTANVVGPPTTATKISWSKETKQLVASYLNLNFQTYKTLADNGIKKIDFLRQMQKDLKLVCSERQLVNGFDALIRKYRKVRGKLNAIGVGSLSVEKSIHKEWIMRACPYFETLDVVFGEGSNDVPPLTIQSSSFGGIGEGSNSYDVASGECCMEPLLDNESSDSFSGDKDNNSNQMEMYNQSAGMSGCSTSKSDKEKDVMHNLVRTTMDALGVPGEKDASTDPESALTMFASVITSIAETMKAVESGKLELEWEKFLFQKQIEERKLLQESEKLAASFRLTEMEHEFQLKKMKAEGDLQMQKLKLEIQLQQLRNNTSDNKHS